jgi:imidazolonepropionase-like amidohydrolase
LTTDAPTLPDLGHTPYAGTSGHTGSTASQERAVNADLSGRTRARQAAALRLLTYAGADGLTWAEIAAATDWHHGTASGTLSVLHKTGAIARLTERRNRSSVYVLPRWVRGRETATPGRTKAGATLTDTERLAYSRLRRAQHGASAFYAADVGTVLAALDRLTGNTQ